MAHLFERPHTCEKCTHVYLQTFHVNTEMTRAPFPLDMFGMPRCLPDLSCKTQASFQQLPREDCDEPARRVQCVWLPTASSQRHAALPVIDSGQHNTLALPAVNPKSPGSCCDCSAPARSLCSGGKETSFRRDWICVSVASRRDSRLAEAVWAE